MGPRLGPQVPIPVDVPDRGLAAQLERRVRRLECRASYDQRRQKLDGDFAHLTYHDPATLGNSGGPITRDQTFVEYYGTIFMLEESPRGANTIWTGSDDGKVFVTRDGGVKWNVTPKDMAKFTRVSSIDASRFGEHRVRRRESLSARRSASVSLEDDELRHLVDAHRRGHRRPASSHVCCARIPRNADCSSPAPSTASTSRSTTAAQLAVAAPQSGPTRPSTASCVPEERDLVIGTHRAPASTSSTTSACCARPRPDITASDAARLHQPNQSAARAAIDNVAGRLLPGQGRRRSEGRVPRRRAARCSRTFTRHSRKTDPHARPARRASMPRRRRASAAGPRQPSAWRKGMNRFTWDLRPGGGVACSPA